MDSRMRWSMTALSAVIFFAVKAGAEPIAASARQSAARSLKFAGYYRGTQAEDLTFAVGGSGACSPANVAILPAPVFACGSTGETAAEGSGQAAVLKVSYQPFDNVQYYATLGTGRYSLSVASVSATTSLTGDKPGWIYGAGLRGLLFPDTIASAALAVDASVTAERYWFNRSQPQVTPAAVNVKDRLDLLRLQLAIEASRRFDLDGRWKAEPYGGLKWVRTQAWLKDLDTGDRFGGIEDAVRPFLGISLPFSDNENLFGEVSFVKGIEYAAGLAVRF